MPSSASRTFARAAASAPRPAATKSIGKAVVLGGSMAGLFAARSLADFAQEVVIVERDALEQSTEDGRPGVPQSRQLHVLLPGGAAQLDRWFPGFTERAEASGAVQLANPDRREYLDGRLRVVDGLDLKLLAASRTFLEKQVRQQVAELPGVRFVAARATGLTFGAGAVTGIEHEGGGSDGAGPGVENADFVVDAMGRSSRVSRWLTESGWDAPPLRRMEVDLHYATALFRGELPGLPVLGSISRFGPGSDSRWAVAAFTKIEHDRWLVLLAGYGEGSVPRTSEEFVRDCQGLPEGYGEVAGLEMIGDVGAYRHRESIRRDFHLAKRFPARLISVGDAVASFNPVYGQGISSAAMQAACLSLFLESAPSLAEPARDFFATQKVVVDAAWTLSTGADLALPHVTGPYPRGYRFSSRVIDQIVTAAALDGQLAAAFERVVFMLDHPSSLAKPGLLLRAVRTNRRDSRSRARSAG